MEKVDHYINTFYQASTRFPICPLLLNRKDNGLDERKSFCETLPGGLDVCASFEEEWANALQ